MTGFENIHNIVDRTIHVEDFKEQVHYQDDEDYAPVIEEIIPKRGRGRPKMTDGEKRRK